MDLMNNLKEKLDSAGIKYRVSRCDKNRIYVYYRNTKTYFCTAYLVSGARPVNDKLGLQFIDPFTNKLFEYDYSVLAFDCIKGNMDDDRSERFWRKFVGMGDDMVGDLKSLSYYFYNYKGIFDKFRWMYNEYQKALVVMGDDDKVICDISSDNGFYCVDFHKPFEPPKRFLYLRVNDSVLRIQKEENVALAIKLATDGIYKTTEGEHKEMDYTHKLLEDCQRELRNACVGIDKYTNGRNSINYLAILFGRRLLAELIGLRNADGTEGNVLLIDYYHHESRCITCAEAARIQIKGLVREVNNNNWQGELSCSTSPAKIGYWAENKGYTLRPRTEEAEKYRSNDVAATEEVTLNVNAMVKVYGNITETLQVRDVLIKKVIFQDPATIVFWADGEKTVVKTQNGEPYDPEKGLAMAIAKRALGNDRGYYKPFLKWVGKYNKKKAKETKELANKIVDKMKAGDWDGVGDLVKHYEFKHEDEEKVRNLRSEGKSFKEIAEILGCEESPIRLLDATDEDPDQ